MRFRCRFYIPIAAAGLTGLLSATILHAGMMLSPDSWGYWQGAVSLQTGHGYTYFYGDLPLTYWPPGYSCYLWGWQHILGVSGHTLIMATVCLAILSSFGWTLLLLAPTSTPHLQSNSNREYVANTAIAIYVGLFIASQYIFLWSDQLLMTLLPPFIILIYKVRITSNHLRQLSLAVITGIVGAALMLTHNRCVAFIAAGAIIVALARPLKVRGIFASIVILIIALLPWMIVRHALGQDSSHPVGFGVSMFPAHAYVVQCLKGIGELLVGSLRQQRPLAALLVLVLAGLLCNAFMFRRNNHEELPSTLSDQLNFYGIYGLVSLIFLFLIFNLTWLDATLTGRFIWFVVLIAVPLSLRLASSRLPIRRLTLLAILFVMVPLVDCVHVCALKEWIWQNKFNHYNFFVEPTMAIHRDGFNTSAKQSGPVHFVTPPFFPWLQNLESERSSTELEGVSYKFLTLEGKRIQFQGTIWNATTESGYLDQCFLVTSNSYISGRGLNMPLVLKCTVARGNRIKLFDSPDDTVSVAGIFHLNLDRNDDGIKTPFRLVIESISPVDVSRQ